MVHEHFVYNTFKNDIALLRLTEPVENKKTVCLPKTSMLNNLQELSYRWVEGDIFDENLSGELKEHVFNHGHSRNCDAQVRKEAISYHYGNENICSGKFLIFTFSDPGSPFFVYQELLKAIQTSQKVKAEG